MRNEDSYNICDIGIDLDAFALILISLFINDYDYTPSSISDNSVQSHSLQRKPLYKLLE